MEKPIIFHSNKFRRCTSVPIPPLAEENGFGEKGLPISSPSAWHERMMMMK